MSAGTGPAHQPQHQPPRGDAALPENGRAPGSSPGSARTTSVRERRDLPVSSARRPHLDNSTVDARTAAHQHSGCVRRGSAPGSRGRPQGPGNGDRATTYRSCCWGLPLWKQRAQGIRLRNHRSPPRVNAGQPSATPKGSIGAMTAPRPLVRHTRGHYIYLGARRFRAADTAPRPVRGDPTRSGAQPARQPTRAGLDNASTF